VERLGFNQPTARAWNVKEASVSQDAVDVHEQELDLASAGIKLFRVQRHGCPRRFGVQESLVVTTKTQRHQEQSFSVLDSALSLGVFVSWW
jgi:hypothetical protein